MPPSRNGRILILPDPLLWLDGHELSFLSGKRWCRYSDTTTPSQVDELSYSTRTVHVRKTRSYFVVQLPKYGCGDAIGMQHASSISNAAQRRKHGPFHMTAYGCTFVRLLVQESVWDISTTSRLMTNILLSLINLRQKSFAQFVTLQVMLKTAFTRATVFAY